MENGYEKASKEIVPAARLAIARGLKARYNMTESDIATILGIAQAAVSKYLNGDYSDVVANTASKIRAEDIDKYIAQIASGDQAALKQCICTVCGCFNEFDCKFSAVKEVSGIKGRR